MKVWLTRDKIGFYEVWTEGQCPKLNCEGVFTANGNPMPGICAVIAERNRRAFGAPYLRKGRRRLMRWIAPLREVL